jgi:regulator of cell morphogenesis and NO signaling
MSSIDNDTLLSDLVNCYPSLTRELERLEIDYCCGGSHTLAQACASRGLDETAVTAELSAIVDGETPTAAEAAVPWHAMGLVQLVDHIEAVHHVRLWTELGRLSSLLDTVTRVHGERHPELAEVRLSFRALRAELEPHLHDEETRLFPSIRRLATAAATASVPAGLLGDVEQLELDHAHTGDLLEHLRRLTGAYAVPADGCGTYRACFDGIAELEGDLHLHVHKENNVLFPAVKRAVRRRQQVRT